MMLAIYEQATDKEIFQDVSKEISGGLVKELLHLVFAF